MEDILNANVSELDCVSVSAQITLQGLSFAHVQSIFTQQIILQGLNCQIISRYL